MTVRLPFIPLTNAMHRLSANSVKFLVGPKAHRRLIPIITDDYPDPDFGSGAVKITGAHDFNDYGVARRNDIPCYRLMDDKAALRADGAPYADCSARAIEIAKSGDLPSEKDVGCHQPCPG